MLGNVHIQIVHFGSIYAQKDSFAHRYGFFEICGSVPLDLGLFGPVARSRRAFYLRRAAGGCFGGHGKLTSGFGRWLRSAGCGLRGFGRWRWLRSAGCGLMAAGCGLRAAWLRALVCVLRASGAGPLRLFVSAGTIVFFSPASPGGPGADPGGIVRTLRLQLPALRIYIHRRADSVDHRTQKNL